MRRAYPPRFTGRQQPGGLGVRFFARLIDGIIVHIFGFFLAFVLDVLSSIWVTGLFSGLLTFIYFVAFEVSQGWTPGKKLLGLRVLGPGGAPKPTPSSPRSATRSRCWRSFPTSVACSP